MPPLNRIMFYTHNSIGLGHIFRTSSLITAIRHLRPHIEFLVLTGSSLPQVLLKDGIEVIKMPGVKQDPLNESNRYRPRYLSQTPIKDLMAFRSKIISQAFDFFKPDVVMLEHKLTGLMGEAAVLFEKKIAVSGKADDFALVHISRGIYGRKEIARRLDLGSNSYDILDLYDHLFILEDEFRAAGWRGVRKSEPVLKEKIRFLGRTIIKNKDELPTRQTVLNRLGLDNRPIILASICRHGDIIRIFNHLIMACENAELLQSRQLVCIVDPYLDADTKSKLEALGESRQVTMLPFIYNLVELINISELVICRAGYNTVSEIQMTGVKALVIPEQHPSGEQELRADQLNGNISVLYEKDINERDLANTLQNMLMKKPVDNYYEFDKYNVGRQIVQYLESWAERS